jgi:hypothetical protein
MSHWLQSASKKRRRPIVPLVIEAFLTSWASPAMKKLFLVLFTVFCLVTVRADILSNGDFSDGKSHWKGDLRAASEQKSNDAASLEHANNTPGVIVDLKPAWTQISQVFNSHETAFTYKITYQLSDDFAPAPEDPAAIISKKHHNPNKPNLFLSKLVDASVAASNVDPPMGNELLLLIVDMSNLTFQEVKLQLNPTTNGQQTFTGTLNELGAHDEKNLFLVFPAGQGSVTLLNVSLTPVGEQKTSTTDSPLHQ